MNATEMKFSKVCDGLVGAEGPVFDTKGNFYVVTPMESSSGGDIKEMKTGDGIAGKLYQINVQTGEKTIACTPLIDNFGGGPCGCQSDKGNNIWIADMRLGILKYTPGKCCEQISKVDTEGNILQGCNDLVFDKDGNLWVTGPASSIAPAAQDWVKAFKENIGCLYYLGKGETIPVRVPGQNFRFCNGIAISNNLLLVAETMTQSIIAFDVTSAGHVENRREWCKLPAVAGGYDHPGIGGPDGIDFDARGRLLVAHYGGSHIEVFSPDGTIEARIKCPFKKPTNLHFKKGSKTCYVTEHDNNAVWKFEWECEGMPMYSDL